MCVHSNDDSISKHIIAMGLIQSLSYRNPSKTGRVYVLVLKKL